ncbi:general transcription factor II-I repeat domain-containing protein 2A [Trichonephila clavipes]|nr:general transcription factor II-I repeat domain-containing protein 2A [Trichonephila clavipes]
MMDLIRAFEAKLYVFRNDIITKNYKYFPNLKKNITDLDAQEKRNEEKVINDFISIMDSLIKEFSARFSQFKELSETFKFIMYPDVISFDKLNLSQFDWLEIEELEMQLIDFQSSSIWIQKFIETRKKLELIEAERLTSNISKNTTNEIWNSIPDAFNCLKKLAYAILTIFSSTYASESLFSEINNIKDSLRNHLTDDSNSACILLKKKWHVDPKRFATPGLESEGNQRLVWPARSPDLNPIENVWDALGRQVAGRNYPPTNKNTLIRALTEEWDKLPQQLLDNVVQSMVRHVECCIALHGGHIPY